MRPKSLHQVLTGASLHDAITDQALLLRRWLRELGFRSEIYAFHIHEALAAEVRPIDSYRPSRQEPYLIFHHSIGTDVVERVLSWPVKLILIYHNVTPAEFFENIDPFWANLMRRGREQLPLLRPQTRLGIGDSEYNRLELKELGFTETAVVPITFHTEAYETDTNPEIVAQFEGLGPMLLFVGRIAPNKRQEDLIKLLYYYCRIEPEAQLVLVGDRWLERYARWLEELAQGLGLASAVHLTGRASQRDMVTYFRTADLYVSMSEHEGFGKPFIESMYFELPILAYAAASTPYTLGDTGVQFHQKDFALLAEVVDLLLKDRPLRARICAKQKQRVRNFLEPESRRLFEEALNKLFTS